MIPGSVCIAWVHSDSCSYSWASAMMALQGNLIASNRPGRMFGMKYTSAGGLPVSRNRGVAHFLDHDEEWLCWVDTDMGFDGDAVERLLEVADPVEHPIVGALCFTNVETAEDGMGGFVTFPIPTIYRWCQQPDGTTGFVSWHDYPRDELYRCDATGSAFIVIHRSVLEKMRATNGDNWYTQIDNPHGGGLFGEDMSFCVQAAQVGAPIHVHTGVKTSHHKPVWLSEPHFDMHREFVQARGVDSQVASGGARPRHMNRAERRAAARAS